MYWEKGGLIRRVYYIGSVIILILSAFIISFPYFTTLRSESSRKNELLTDAIYDQKKAYIKALVVEKISDINFIKENILLVYPDLSEAEQEILFREKVRALIYSTELPDNGYVWINEIQDYNGGDNYAVRLVHPNLPGTEGDFLSTKTTDIHGNKPYLEELEGIKKNGEIFFNYYFQKKDSDKISHKLSYAKLYEPYNWVVATGLYLDDLDLLIEKETQSMHAVFIADVRTVIITIIIAAGLSILVMIFFETKINKMIQKYTSELSDAYNRIEQMAYIDFLTGLWNRRGMYVQMKKEISRSNRENRNFCLLMGDIDFFKSINDNHGHDCGDFVLKVFAEIFRSVVRAEDSLARWGGEEFLLLINSANREQGAAIAEKIRRAVEEKDFIYNGNTLKITMTFGVAVFDHTTDVDFVINQADEKLYDGKNSGRNCVVT